MVSLYMHQSTAKTTKRHWPTALRCTTSRKAWNYSAGREPRLQVEKKNGIRIKKINNQSSDLFEMRSYGKPQTPVATVVHPSLFWLIGRMMMIQHHQLSSENEPSAPLLLTDWIKRAGFAGVTSVCPPSSGQRRPCQQRISLSLGFGQADK